MWKAFTPPEEKAGCFFEFKQINYKQVSFDPFAFLRVYVQGNKSVVNWREGAGAL